MAFRAKNGLEAQDWLDTAQTIRAELMVLQSEGKPLWDGRMEIIARAATLAEKAAYRRKSVEMSFADEDHNPDDALALLVPVKEVIPTANSHLRRSGVCTENPFTRLEV